MSGFGTDNAAKSFDRMGEDQWAEAPGERKIRARKNPQQMMS